MRHLALPRRGLTLIDLIVGLGLLAFLLALAAPFVFRLMGQRQRVDSQNNLHQIAIATHAYHDTDGGFPPVVGQDKRKGSIFWHLLPFIEQNALYGQGGVWEAGTIGQPIVLYIHPRDQTAPAGHRFEGWLATSNYAGNWLVFQKGGRTLPQITDGTSNTICYAERYQVCNGEPTAWGYDRLYYWAPVFAYYSTEKFQHQPGAEDCDPARPQSLAAAGINVAMCDASVRVVGPHVSSSTWDAALTPNAGDELGPDW